MFGRLFKRSRKDEVEVYRPKERMIYAYFDGEKEVKADPLALFKKVAAVGPELSVSLKVSRSLSKDAAKASDEADASIRQLFGVKPFGEGGLTEVECLQLLDHFMAYCDDLKKKGSPSPTSSTPTGASPSTSDGAPTTQTSSPSGSTNGAPSTGAPTPSPTGAGSASGSSTPAWSSGGP